MKQSVQVAQNVQPLKKLNGDSTRTNTKNTAIYVLYTGQAGQSTQTVQSSASTYLKW